MERKGNFLARSVRFLRGPSPPEQAELLQCPEVNYLNEAFERLLNLRARQVTSMFHSTSKNVKWVPNGVIATEVAYEFGQEWYSEIQLDGKRPANAPAIGDAEYMRSFNNAWSTGDFETIAHCVFDGLVDSDFHKTGTEHGDDGDLVVYEFSGGRASTCVAVRSESQVAYPSYRGSLKVKPQTEEVVHVALEAFGMPKGCPLDRAERLVDFGPVQVGAQRYLRRVEEGRWTGSYRQPVVSLPRSSNRTCPFRASGFPTDFTTGSRKSPKVDIT